jgi:hypothetical protein
MVMASNREMANELRAHLQASQSKHPKGLKLEDLCIGPDGRVRAVMEVAAGGDVQKLHRTLGALSDLDVLPQAARAAVERDMAAQMLSGIAAKLTAARHLHKDHENNEGLLRGSHSGHFAVIGEGFFRHCRRGRRGGAEVDREAAKVRDPTSGGTREAQKPEEAV